jgi:protein phosphatase
MVAMVVEFAVSTDKGAVRSENEDRWLAEPAVGLFGVADGMGGMLGGGLAAQLAMDCLPRLLATEKHGTPSQLRDSVQVESRLAAAVRTLNRMLRSESAGYPGLHGMGAAIVIGWFSSQSVAILHLGDCRAYHFRRGELTMLTSDHNLAALLRSEPAPQPLGDNAASRQLVQFLGMPGEANPTVKSFSWNCGDLMLFCSDGLTNQLDDKDISLILGEDLPLADAAARLVETANRRGGIDNATVLLVKQPNCAERAGS